MNNNRIRDFEVQEKIGEGSFSVVYRVKKDSDGGVYALKKVKIMKLKEKDKENTLNEIRILASIHDRNIIEFKESFIEEESSCLW
jgi:NIMA (never in mitosis gene a)-related kinase